MAVSGQTTEPYGEQPMEPGAPMGQEPMPMGPAPMEAPPPSKRITSGGVVAIVGGIIMLISLALDWMFASMSAFGISISEGAGPFEAGVPTEVLLYAVLVLIMGILAIVMVAAKKPIGAGIFGLIGFIVALVAFLRIQQQAAEVLGIGGGIPGIEISAGSGFGVYLALIGGILAMIGGFVGHKQM